MADVVGPLVSTLAQRARDPRGLGHTRDLVRSLLDRTQTIVNLGARLVVGTATFATEANRQVYPVDAVALGLDLEGVRRPARIISVRDDDGSGKLRDLDEVDWTTLLYADPVWFRQVGARFEVWAPLGLRYFILHPAKAEASTVTVSYLTVTAPLPHDGSMVDLAEEYRALWLDVTEALLLLRQREFESVSSMVGRLRGRLDAARR